MALADPLPPGALPARFSLLMPVYHGDEATRVRRALESNTVEQTRPPAQVVVVQDGPVPAAVTQVLDAFAARDDVGRVTRVEVPVNGGLTAALNLGLGHCAHDVVARADADDVSYPHRFQRQLPLVEAGADVVGSSMHEIAQDESCVALRQAPVGREEIRKVSRRRNPISHPSVVFRRSAVEAVGGYQHVPMAEDYWLWARMLRAGAEIHNVGEPLVGYRVSAGSYERRGGWDVFRAELTLQSKLRRLGLVSFLQWATNVIVRGGYRFVPLKVRETAYRLMVGRRGRTITAPKGH